MLCTPVEQSIKFEDIKLDSWKQNIDWQMNSYFYMSQQVAIHMSKQKKGVIVNIASTYGLVGADQRIYGNSGLNLPVSYAASKGALSTATKILAKELGPKGIRVNSVYMGWMWGPPVEMYVNFTAESMGVKPKDVIDGVTKDIPLGIIPDDSDCANAALFLISDLAKVITGANLDVNGGEFMS